MEPEKLNVEFVPHVLYTSNRTCFFPLRLSNQKIGHEGYLLLQTQQAHGNTQSPACYQSAIIAKGLINCLLLQNE